MQEKQVREEYDTGLKKIRQEIKSLLVPYGLFGIVTEVDGELQDYVPNGSKVELSVKGRTVTKSFDRRQIEGCCLRVGGTVLVGITAMVDEISASPHSPALPAAD